MAAPRVRPEEAGGAGGQGEPHGGHGVGGEQAREGTHPGLCGTEGSATVPEPNGEGLRRGSTILQDSREEEINQGVIKKITKMTSF